MSEVTRIINAVKAGDARAADELMPLVYNELRRLAAQRLAKESSGQTLQATALVHEAYLRLTDVDQPQHWNGRGHFFAAAAEAMRRILIENARRRQRTKHGGDRQRLDLDAVRTVDDRPNDEVLAVDDALETFAAEACKGGTGQASLLCGTLPGGGGGTDGDFRCNCQAALGLRTGLAVFGA